MFFIWTHLDLFIAMQHYLTGINSIDRPTYKEVSGSKCKDVYPGAYKTETTETVNIMTKVKSPTSGVITTGLWPLDHESNHDWRHTTHQKSVWTQWVYMARIEKILVDTYRKKMLRKCKSAHRIRETLETLLSPLCTPNIVTVSKRDKAAERKFYWPDNIIVASTPEEESTGQTVDVEELRANVSRKAETDAMIDELTGIFKKLHTTKAGLAIRGQPLFFRGIVEKLESLEDVCNDQLGRSEDIPHKLTLTFRNILTTS